MVKRKIFIDFFVGEQRRVTDGLRKYLEICE